MCIQIIYIFNNLIGEVVIHFPYGYLEVFLECLSNYLFFCLVIILPFGRIHFFFPAPRIMDFDTKLPYSTHPLLKFEHNAPRFLTFQNARNKFHGSCTGGCPGCIQSVVPGASCWSSSSSPSGIVCGCSHA